MRKLLTSMLIAFSAWPLAALDAANITGTVKIAGLRDGSNTVVYIDKIPGKVFPPPKEPIKLDQLNLVFVPHVRPLLLGSKVAFPNSDEVRHNVFSPSSTQAFNLGTYPSGITRYRVFDKPGQITLLCKVHAQMSAYILVIETPYFATTDKDGNYTIPNVPPGHYTLKVWHERFSKTQSRAIDITDADINQDFDLKH
jgi:plastocyanin